MADKKVDRKEKVETIVGKVRDRLAVVRKVTDMVLNLLGPVLMVGGAAVSLFKRHKKVAADKVVAEEVVEDVKDDVVED